MLDLRRLNLEEVADALADQTDYEHRWLINPETGEIVFWTSDTGIDGQDPVDPDELDLIGIDPLPPHVWHQDMADFAEQIHDEQAGRRLARAIQGRGAFRRFKDELHEEYPHLLPARYAFRDNRAHRRAVERLSDNSLIADTAATNILSSTPTPTYRNPRPTYSPAAIRALISVRATTGSADVRASAIRCHAESVFHVRDNRVGFASRRS